jgi:hypothetical protein
MREYIDALVEKLAEEMIEHSKQQRHNTEHKEVRKSSKINEVIRTIAGFSFMVIAMTLTGLFLSKFCMSMVFD